MLGLYMHMDIITSNYLTCCAFSEIEHADFACKMINKKKL